MTFGGTNPERKVFSVGPGLSATFLVGKLPILGCPIVVTAVKREVIGLNGHLTPDSIALFIQVPIFSPTIASEIKCRIALYEKQGSE